MQIDRAGAYSFTPAHVLAERRRKAAEDEEWAQHFDGKTPALITWDDWEELSYWWVTNATYWHLPAVRMIESSDISTLLDWRMPFRLVLQKLDFRVLLILMRLNTAFKALVEAEVSRRKLQMIEKGFFSDKTNWFMARRCEVIAYIDERKACNLWEEITTYGENQKCRKCIQRADRSRITKGCYPYSQTKFPHLMTDPTPPKNPAKGGL